MKNIVSIVLIFVAYISFSQGHSLKYDTIQDKERGLIGYGYTLEGNKIGIWKWEDSKTPAYLEYNYIDTNRLIIKSFDSSNVIQYVYNYILEVVDSTEKWYKEGIQVEYVNGFPRSVTTYNKNEKDYISMRYYPSHSKLYNRIELVEIEYGESNSYQKISYYRNGNIKESGQFCNNYSCGQWIYYYENGNISRSHYTKVVKNTKRNRRRYSIADDTTGEYFSVIEGECKIWNEDGSLERIDFYKKGVIRYSSSQPIK